MPRTGKLSGDACSTEVDARPPKAAFWQITPIGWPPSTRPAARGATCTVAAGYAGNVPIIHQAVAVKAAMDAMGLRSDLRTFIQMCRGDALRRYERQSAS